MKQNPDSQTCKFKKIGMITRKGDSFLFEWKNKHGYSYRVLVKATSAIEEKILIPYVTDQPKRIALMGRIVPAALSSTEQDRLSESVFKVKRVRFLDPKTDV